MWDPYNIDDSVVLRVPVYEGINQKGAFIQAEVCVSYWNE